MHGMQPQVFTMELTCPVSLKNELLQIKCCCLQGLYTINISPFCSLIEKQSLRAWLQGYIVSLILSIPECFTKKPLSRKIWLPSCACFWISEPAFLSGYAGYIFVTSSLFWRSSWLLKPLLPVASQPPGNLLVVSVTCYSVHIRTPCGTTTHAEIPFS